MDLGLSGRVAVITGGSRGIGRACAAALAAEGAHVVVASLDPARNAQACESITAKAKGRVLGIPTDLVQDSAVRALFERTLAEFGRLDILVNNAAVVGAGDFASLNEEKLAHAFEHKLNGAVRCTRYAVPPMRARKWGRIINVAGGAAWHPQLGAITVGLNNAAMLNLTMALANDLAKDGILVNAVVPSSIRTERHDDNIRQAMQKSGKSEAEVLAPRITRIPLGRMGTSEEVGAVVAFLVSERASFVTGSTWAVDGGATARL
jgi:NAD(P)-dependent dehydrogenase (short-subunit alcohol dehydrogenase family)